MRDIGIGIVNNTDQVFLQNNIYTVINRLSDHEKLEFESDVAKVDWDRYVVDYMEGAAIWVNNQDLIEPRHNLD